MTPSCPTCGASDRRVRKGRDGKLWCFTCKRIVEGEPAPAEDEKVDAHAVETWHEALLATPELLKHLVDKRLLDEKTVKRYRIGIDGRNQYTVPIPNGKGGWATIKRLRRVDDGKPRLIPQENLGAHLYPLPIRGREAVICEGEWDCLAARARGFNSYTGGAGAGSFPLSWARYFLDMVEVAIVYDVDLPGRQGAGLVARRLIEAGLPARAVKVVQLPLGPGQHPGKDLLDWFLGGASGRDLRELIDSTHHWGLRQLKAKSRGDRSPASITLPELGREEHAGKWVSVPAALLALGQTPVQLPTRVELACPRDWEGKCQRCAMPVLYEQALEQAAADRRSAEEAYPAAELNVEDPDYLSYVRAPKDVLRAQLLKEMRVLPKCPHVELRYTGTILVHEARVSDLYDVSASKAPVERPVLLMGLELEPNATYRLVGKPLPSPRDQSLTLVAHEAEPLDRATEGWTEVPSLFKPIRRLKGVASALATLADDAARITGIWERRDLHLGVLLAYCSALWLVPDASRPEEEQRGWIDCLVIGDTAEGKTTVSSLLMKWIGLGERVVLKKRTSIAGMLGGSETIDGRRYLIWGVIPRANDRLVILEEAHGVSHDIKAALTDMRSSGVAEVILGGNLKQKTPARTRAIYIANGPGPLAAQAHGVEVVPWFWGATEDVRRTDYVIFVEMNEVAPELRQRDREEAPVLLTRTVSRHLVLRAWARTRITIPTPTASAAKALAVDLSRQFVNDIPLLHDGDLRWKLLRIATAAGNLMAEEVPSVEHVEWASRWLYEMYSRPIVGFLDYARTKKALEHVRNEAEVWGCFSLSDATGVRVEDTVHRATLFLSRAVLTARDFADFVPRGDRDLGDMMRAKLLINNAISMEPGGFFAKTPGCVHLLRRKISEFGGNSCPSGLVTVASDSASMVPPSSTVATSKKRSKDRRKTSVRSGASGLRGTKATPRSR